MQQQKSFLRNIEKKTFTKKTHTHNVAIINTCTPHRLYLICYSYLEHMQPARSSTHGFKVDHHPELVRPAVLVYNRERVVAALNKKNEIVHTPNVKYKCTKERVR